MAGSHVGPAAEGRRETRRDVESRASKSVKGNGDGLLLTSLKILGLLAAISVFIVAFVQLSFMMKGLKEIRTEVSSLKKELTEKEEIDTGYSRFKNLTFDGKFTDLSKLTGNKDSTSCNVEISPAPQLRIDPKYHTKDCEEGDTGCCFKIIYRQLSELLGPDSTSDLPNGPVPIRVCQGVCGARVLGESSVADFVRNRPCVPYGTVDLDYSVNNDLGSKLYKIPFSHRECVCGA